MAGNLVTVIEISKEQHMSIAGKPWAEALAAVNGTDVLRLEIPYLHVGTLKEGQPREYGESGTPRLAFGYVWLREVDKRAFLYLTNY